MASDDPIAIQITTQLKLMQNWVTSHVQLFESLEAQEHFGYELFVRSSHYSGIFIEALGLQIEEQNESLLSMSGIKQLDSQINTIKAKVLECLSHLLEFVFNTMDGDQKANIPYFIKIQGVIPMIIKTAHHFATSPTLPSLLLEEQNKEMINQVLEVLILLAGEQNMIDIFVENQTLIIVSVCLNLMATTNEEANMITNDPQEFVTLALDCCDK